MMYDGTKWVKMRGANVFPTPDPVPGDLWLDEDFHAPGHPTIDCIAQLMFWDGTQWCSVADGYVLKAGDTMFGNLQMIDAAQTVYGNVGTEHMIINEGDGDVTVCPDIHKIVGDLALASVESVNLIFDSDNNGSGEFFIRKGGKNTLTADWCARVEQDCTISVNPTLNYETLVTDDDDIPNWRAVLDELLNNYLRLDGTNAPMLGNVDWGGFQIQNLGDPTADDHAMPRLYADNRYVNILGDTMTGTLDFTVDGFISPAICGQQSLVIASNQNVAIIIDKDNSDVSSVFRVMKDDDNITGATGLMTVLTDGTIQADTGGYAALLGSYMIGAASGQTQGLTSKAYVDDAIDDAFLARTGGVSTIGPSERHILVWNRDVFWTGTQLLMARGAGSGVTEIIFPAQYVP